MGKIYKYDVPFGAGDGATVIYGYGNTLNGNGMTQGSGGGVTLDTHQIWGQPFNGKRDVDGDLTITHGNIEMGCGDVHVGSVSDNEAAEGGNLTVDKHTKTNTLEVTEGADIGGDLDVGGSLYVISDLTTDGHLYAEGGAEIYGDTYTDSITSPYGVIDEIKSTLITTDYLTVLKSATFYEVIIEKLKSIGGSIILSPADGFVVSDVEPSRKRVVGKRRNSIYLGRWDEVIITATCFKLYWIAETSDDMGNTITLDNQWQKGDMMMCQSFNIKQGTTSNAATKYYWCVVTDVGTVEATEDTPRKNWIEIVDNGTYYYPENDREEPSDGSIQISRFAPNCTFKDPGCVVNPSVGDNIVHLGNVYSLLDKTNRGNAIYISCVTSRDYGLTPPFIATYKEIDSYDLGIHRHSQISPNGNFLRGTFYAGNDDRPINEVMDDINGKIGTLEQGHDDQGKVISSLIVSSNAIKTRVEQVETGYSELKQSLDGFKITVNNTLDNHSTQISQNAQQISFYADEIEKLKITRDKIILNGDTEVNGTVSINKTGVGFTLLGNNGERFDITSKSIGTYSSFSSANNNLLIVFAKSTSASVTVTGGLTSTDSQGPWSKTNNPSVYVYKSLGVIKKGTQISIRNFKFSSGNTTVSPNSSLCSGSGRVVSASIRISTSTSTGNSVAMSPSYSSNQSGTILTYTAAETREYYIIGQLDFTVTATLRKGSSGGTSSAMEFQPSQCTATTTGNIWCDVYGTTDAHGQIAYDGIGINFGGGKVCFMGNDCAVIKYGDNAAIKISTDGLEKLVPVKTTNHTLYSDNREVTSNYQKAGQWVSINSANTVNYTNSQISNCGNSTKDSGYKMLCLCDDDEFVTLYTSYNIDLRLPNISYVSPGHKIIIKRIDGGSSAYRKVIRVRSANGSSKFYAPDTNYVDHYDINERTVFFISNGTTWIMGYCG